MSFDQEIMELNEEIRSGVDSLKASNFHSCYVFSMESYKDCKLVLHGTTLAYGHEIELVFEGVEWVNCPTFFEDPDFSYTIECSEEGEVLMKIEFSQYDTPKSWFVVAKSMNIEYCENLNKN